MNNFEAYNPTRIVFGRNQYQRIPELIKEAGTIKTVLLAYGGGSIKKNGVYDAVQAVLSDFRVIEYGGIEANPEYTTLLKITEQARAEQVDFILAVGGGSVIDGIKFVSGAMHYEGDPWDVLLRKSGCTFDKTTPFGTVLTIPATGSEANSGAVISRSEWNEKRTMGGPQFFPRFSICDPQVVASLPERQIANGIMDAFMHTLEQYLTYPSGNLLQERQAEAILITLKEIGPHVMKDPGNYELAANLMWCATHALNGNLRAGVPTDWCTHMIGHELTAFYGIDHARTLAIIAPRLFENQFENKKTMLEQYGRRVWNLSGDGETVARQAIRETEVFFQSLGTDTHIAAYTDDYLNLATTIRKRFEERGWTRMGERMAITPEDVEQIVANAY